MHEANDRDVKHNENIVYEKKCGRIGWSNQANRDSNAASTSDIVRYGRGWLPEVRLGCQDGFEIWTAKLGANGRCARWKPFSLKAHDISFAAEKNIRFEYRPPMTTGGVKLQTYHKVRISIPCGRLRFLEWLIVAILRQFRLKLNPRDEIKDLIQSMNNDFALLLKWHQ